MKVRRVATGHTLNGKSVVASDIEIEGETISLLPGFEYHKLWGADHSPRFPDDGSEPSALTYFPPCNGYRFMLVTLPADPTSKRAPPDRDALFSEMELTMPGFAAHMERNMSGMHTSDTIDFAYIVSGEIWLELDDSKQVHLRAGDTIVQNGTRHTWRNMGLEPCNIVFIAIGASRKPSGIEVAHDFI